jgi:hypothetical protein
MKPFVILCTIFLCSCSGLSARRSFFGNWKETAEIKQQVSFGYFTVVQHQVYWADRLDNCEMDISFTNTSRYIVSFNFETTFALSYTFNSYNEHKNRNGNWTYTNAVMQVKPNQTVSFRNVSKRVVDIKDGVIYFDLSNIKLERITE